MISMPGFISADLISRRAMPAPRRLGDRPRAGRDSSRSLRRYEWRGRDATMIREASLTFNVI